MTKVVIIPEPHLWDKSFVNRIRYPQEIVGYLFEISDMVKELKQTCDDVRIIFMGDVFHRGYSDAIKLVNHIQVISSMRDIVDGELYSLVGNHEISYSRMNPFWMLADLKSKIYGTLSALPEFGAANNVIKVVDELVIDNTLITFGHYNRSSYEYDWEMYKNVVHLSHNSILDAEVGSMIQKYYGMDVKAEFIHTRSVRETGVIPHTENLRHVFVGHMHMAHGQYNVQENIQGKLMDFKLEYVQSTGRTSHAEVVNSNLERKIPILEIDGDKFGVDYWSLMLKPREEVINETLVAESQDKYSKTKAIQKMKKSDVMASNPVEDLKVMIQQISPENLMLFNQLMKGSPIEDLQKLIQEGNNVRIYN